MADADRPGLRQGGVVINGYIGSVELIALDQHVIGIPELNRRHHHEIKAQIPHLHVGGFNPQTGHLMAAGAGADRHRPAHLQLLEPGRFAPGQT